MTSVESPVILVVEDEPKLNALLCDYLRASNMAPVPVHDGPGVLPSFETSRPALVLLDLNLPGLDGVSVCKHLRSISTVPIVMMTARVDEVDRLLGLEAGADDYICKPYSPREVVARVKAQLRRLQWGQAPAAGGQPSALLSSPVSEVVDSPYPRVHIDLDQWRVRLDDEPVDLTPAEVRLLNALHARPGQVFSRHQLLDHLHHDGRAVTDRVIDSHVRNLRRKLASVGPGLDPIRSVYGVGYAFEWPAGDG